MLHLIKGKAGSGKTAFIRGKMNELAGTKGNKVVLLVPEQFSFESERVMLKTLGAKKMKAVDIFGFPRMAFSVLKNAGVLKNNIPDKGVKSAIMSEALVNLQDELEVFKGFRHSASALDSLLEFSKEMKYCSISSDLLNEKLSLMEDGFLKNKLHELDLINEAYSAILTQSYFDDNELLDFFNYHARKNDYFRNKTVFLDGFRGFTKQEYECLSLILSQADDVFITLCINEAPLKFSAFYHNHELEKKLRAVAAKAGCKVDECYLNQPENAFPSDIFALEKNLFSEKDIIRSESDGSIEIVACKDLQDECRFVGATIKKLLRSGKYRCRDIAVIERSGSYKTALINVLKGYGIPVFDDSRRNLSNEALFIFVSSAIECAFKGITTEALMRYLKTGFGDLSLEEISTLEKYALIWGIGAREWKNGFFMHPDGFGESLDEKAAQRLEYLNELRKRAVMPIIKLKNASENQSFEAVCLAVYEFLEETSVRDKLFDLQEALDDNGFSLEASRQETSWNALVSVLETMAKLFNGKHYSLKRWNELFDIFVSCGDIGEIPQGIDEVTVGTADRIRTEKLKVVFLVGCNKDEFPLVNVKKGILTDSDRVTLINDLGLEVREPFEDSVNEEKFITYCSVTAGNEKLYISYKTGGEAGEVLVPSEIVETAEASVSDILCISTADLPCEYFIESVDAAFSALARAYNDNSTVKATLLEYLGARMDFKGKISALSAAAGNEAIRFENAGSAVKLFGENIHLSASRVEGFYNCPFAYFLRYGLGAEPLSQATLDPSQSGTIIHYLLETVLREYPAGVLTRTDNGLIEESVIKTLNGYLEEKMGGVEAKSKRFMFLFERLVEIVMTVISRLKAEFETGSFEPCEFELKIGGDKVGAYKLPLENGYVELTGYVDRVDIFEKDDLKYLRIIDYKTGKKDFKLSELLDGLNIQMVLYLMAIEKNGSAHFGDIIPSGVLYLPSRIGISSYLDRRSPSEENVAAQKIVSGKLSGMVLDSPVVLNGMGVDVKPDYFPVSYNARGTAKGNYYSLKQFKALSKIIDDKIIDMAEALKKGEIAAIPCGKNNKGKMCEYCSYKAVCGREQGAEVKELSGLKHPEALKRLEVVADEQEMD